MEEQILYRLITCSETEKESEHRLNKIKMRRESNGGQVREIGEKREHRLEIKRINEKQGEETMSKS